MAGSARSPAAQIGVDVPVLISWPVTAGTMLLCLALVVGAAAGFIADAIRESTGTGPE